MNCVQAKQIDFVEYLEYLNHFPVHKSKSEYCYFSPLRKESNPSFFVNSSKGTFYDFGTGNGGTIIDFGVQYHRCTISEFLVKLEQFSSFRKIPNRSSALQAERKNASVGDEGKIIIRNVIPIFSRVLQDYIQSRGISMMLAYRFCSEIHYELYGNHYYAIGFKNDMGGYELRNQHVKLSSKPKGITFLNRGFNEVAVFEGYFSFLSFLELHPFWEQLETNFLILNSLAFFKKSKSLMESHQLVILYLDRDIQGFRRTYEVLQENAIYRNGSISYRGFKDWNKYLLNRKPVKPHIKRHDLKTSIYPDQKDIFCVRRSFHKMYAHTQAQATFTRWQREVKP